MPGTVHIVFTLVKDTQHFEYMLTKHKPQNKGPISIAAHKPIHTSFDALWHIQVHSTVVGTVIEASERIAGQSRA